MRVHLLKILGALLLAFPAQGADTCTALFGTSVRAAVASTAPQRELWFDALFREAAGVTPEALLKMYKMENPLAGEIQARLQQGDFSFALQAPQQHLETILQQGFKNLHETKTGGGIENLTIRTAVELSMSGLSAEKYQSLPLSSRPKYAMLWPSVTGPLQHYTARIEYGDIVFILKNENVKERATWSPLDSFDLLRDQYYDDLAKGKVPKNLTWYQQFIPMSRLELATLFIHEYDKASFARKSLNRSFMPKKLKAQGEVLDFNPPERANSYLEFQIWGELKPQDIQAIVFLAEPPSIDSLRLLKELSIDVYDGRTGSRHLWNPGN